MFGKLKTAEIEIPGSGRTLTADVNPGLTVQQMIEQIGFNGDKVRLEDPNNGRGLDPKARVGEVMPASGRFSMTPHMDAGAGMTYAEQLQEVRWLKENNWSFDGSAYSGWIPWPGGWTAARAMFRGGGYEVMLHDPPTWLLGHSHFGTCFTEMESDWWFLHQNDRHSDLAMAVEGLQSFMRECREENLGEG